MVFVIVVVRVIVPGEVLVLGERLAFSSRPQTVFLKLNGRVRVVR